MRLRHGLRYYRARYYDANIGRLISEDPIGFEGGGNFYRYVSNDPTALSDPSGLFGGPKGPPLGVKPGCRGNDNCQAIRGKIWLLTRILFSHIGWDLAMPSPRGGDRHDQEILEFNAALDKCVDLWIKKKCDCDGGSPTGDPTTQPAEQPRFKPLPLPYIGPILDRILDPIAGGVQDALDSIGNTIKNGPPTQPTPWGPMPVPPVPIPVIP